MSAEHKPQSSSDELGSGEVQGASARSSTERSPSNQHSSRYGALARDALDAVERHTKENGGDHFCDYFGCGSVQPLALAIIHLEEQLQSAQRDLEDANDDCALQEMRAREAEGRFSELVEQNESLRLRVEIAEAHEASSLEQLETVTAERDALIRAIKHGPPVSSPASSQEG